MPTPARTTRADIISAARALLETGGVEAVTMAAVASRVGVRAPSLYKHVRDREEMLVLVTDAAVDDLAERLRDAQGTLAALARAYRAFAAENPEAFALILGSRASVDRLADAAAPVLAAVAALVGESDALAGARLMTAWMTGFIAMERAGAFRLGGDVETAFSWGLDRLESALRGRPRA